MCIIHELHLHHIFQNIMEAFERSQMISSLFMKRVGYLLCTCKTDSKFDSKSIISTQRSFYLWFEEILKDQTKEPLTIKNLYNFKQIVDDLKEDGNIDSDTKIIFMNLFRDIYSLNFSKLRQSPMFYSKIVRIKFDLKLCSAKEFCSLITKIDNCAIKYIQITNKCNIVIRDPNTLNLRHFMGEIDATIEAVNEKYLFQAELSIKRLADAVHYRLAKQIPSSDTITNCSINNLRVLLQSPPQSFKTSKIYN